MSDDPIHHVACVARYGLDCVCVQLRELALRPAKPGKVVQFAFESGSSLAVLTESGELWAQVTDPDDWHWELIPGPTAADRQQPTEKESANGKEGT